MNSPLFPILLLSLALASCERPADRASIEEDAREQAAIRAEAERLEAEQDRLERDREALEAEKEELRQLREAALAEREAELDDREFELQTQDEATQQQLEEVALQQQELAQRELELSEQALEQAGSTVIEDWTPTEPEVVQQPVADYNLFYDELEPHGSWFETPDYGYVYQPTVVVQNRSWRPYTRGRWVCSNLGWTWRSDEPFGWATFHYGRWVLLASRGWCWVPGSEWAPSWCAWRYGDGHVGWAPLPPETLAYRRGWGATVGADFGIGHSWFNFVATRHMAAPAYRHCLPVNRNRHFFGQTRGCTNLRYQGFQVIAGGPSYKLIKPLIHDPWPVYRLDLNRVGGFGRGHQADRLRNGRLTGNQLQVFAPSLDAPWNPGLRPKRVRDRWKKVEVLRSESPKEAYTRRFAEVRKRQQETARKLATANQERREAQLAQLERNREAVAAAQERYRENLQRQSSLKQGRGTVGRARPDKGVTTGQPGRGRSRGNPVADGQTGNRLPPGMSRPGEKPAVPTFGDRGKGRDEKAASPTPVADRLAELRKKQQEARQRAAQQAKGRQAQQPSRPTGRGTPAGNNALTERLEQARLEREQATRKSTERQTQARNAQQEQLRLAQERMRQQQEQSRAAQGRSRGAPQPSRAAKEQNRAAQEQAKQNQQERLRAQQAQARAAQEQAKQAAAERVRQQQAKLKQQQEAARKAAEERARQQQAAARKAAEDRARQQAEIARRQEEARRASQERARQQQERARQQQEAARRAAQERARQQQEAARRAAEERARQQQQNQQKLREAQERMRERIREQQEKRKK